MARLKSAQKPPKRQEGRQLYTFGLKLALRVDANKNLLNLIFRCKAHTPDFLKSSRFDE